MKNKVIQKIDNEIKPRKREKLEEEMSLNEELEHLLEMAVIGKSCGAFRMVVRANSPYRNTNITNWEQAINAYEDQRETFHPGQI